MNVTTTQTISATGATAWFQVFGGDNHILLEGTPGGSTVTLQVSLEASGTGVETDSDGSKIFEAVNTQKSAIVTVATGTWCRFNVVGGTPALTVQVKNCSRA